MTQESDNSKQPAKPPPGGHVRCYRAEMDDPVWASDSLWRLWSWCRFRAAHRPTTASIQTGRGVTVVPIDIGQFVFGRDSAARELGWPPKTTENRLRKLEKLGKVARQPARQYTIVTVCDYGLYGGTLPGNGPPTGPPMAHQWPTDGPPNGHRQEQPIIKETKKGVDHKESRSWSDIEQTVVSRARELKAVAPPANEPAQRRQDIDLLLRVAYLEITGRIAQDAVEQSLEAIRKRSGGPPERPVAFLRSVLDGQVGLTLSALLKSVVVPASLLDRLVGPPQSVPRG